MAYHTYTDTVGTSVITLRENSTAEWQRVSDLLTLPDGVLGSLRIRYRPSTALRISTHPQQTQYVLAPANEWLEIPLVNGHTTTWIRADDAAGMVDIIVEGRQTEPSPRSA